MVKTCRICLGGEADEPECGRLFSPCRCKGSVRYVHVQCLERWRQSSAKKEAYFQCDLCHYRYSFSRTTYAALVSSEPVILMFALMFLGGLIVFAGYVLKLFGYATETTSFWIVDLEHLTLGTVGVGVFGCLHLLFSFTSLIHVGNPFGSFGRINSGGSGGSGNDAGKLLLIIVVLVGVLRVLYTLYMFARQQSKLMMGKLGTTILEVPGGKDDADEDVDATPASSGTSAAHPLDADEWGATRGAAAPPPSPVRPGVVAAGVDS